MRFRQSSMKTWMACPLQAHLDLVEPEKRKQNARATFGTVVHKALEAYHNGVSVDAAVALFREYWDEPERLGVKPDVWPKYTTYGGLREKGAEIIRQYHEKAKWEQRNVIAAEHRFLVPIGRHELEGTVDFLEFKKAGNGQRTLRICDLKTSSWKPNIAELRLDIQFTTYAYASLQPEFWLGNGPDFPGMVNGQYWWDHLQDVKRRGIWFHLMTNQELDAGERTDDDFMRLYRLCNEIERAMEHEVFVPKIGDACLFCSHTKNCAIEIPNREELELEVL